MKQRKDFSVGLFTVGIAALFLLGFLLLVIFGARTYKNTVGSQYGNNDTRSILSYLAAAVKSCDEQGCVYVLDGADGQTGGQVLVLEDGTGFALRIFCEDGRLYEDYGRTGTPPQAAQAQVIGSTAGFRVTMEGTHTLRVETDEGVSILDLRSERN